jgi:hypothetical protein
LATLAAGGGRLLAFRGTGSSTFHVRNAGETNWSTVELPWAVSIDGSVYTSPVSAAFGNGTFLLTRGIGYVLQSDPLTNTPPRITRQPVAHLGGSDARVTLRVSAAGSTPMRYQWRREGTNLPSANLESLSLPSAEILSHRITVLVENAFGTVESEAAPVIAVAPGRLEMAASGAQLMLHGTSGSRYWLEFCPEPGSGVRWTRFGEVEVPASGRPARVPDLWRSDEWPQVTRRFFRAVFLPR